MKLYHTETQRDYDALMVELEEQGCMWLSGRKPTEATTYWKLHSRETCVKVDEKVIEFETKRYYTLRYPGVSIIKYKARTEDKMKIYHTETQEDYDALMIELEEQGCFWDNGFKIKKINSKWEKYVNNTCVRVDGRIAFYDEKDYYVMKYPNIPITKYKAKADEKTKFTKENIYRLFGDYRRGKNGINRLDNLESVIMDLDDTPEKVVVPKCFDEWFKEIVVEYPITDSSKRFALWKLSQQGFGHGFEDARGKEISYETELGGWLLKNKELAIDAVLNGYAVEPEQLYYIPLPHLETSDGTKQVLSKRKGYKNYFAHYPTESLQQEYTKAELEQVPEIYRLFAVPVEEERE